MFVFPTLRISIFPTVGISIFPEAGNRVGKCNPPRWRHALLLDQASAIQVPTRAQTLAGASSMGTTSGLDRGWHKGSP